MSLTVYKFFRKDDFIGWFIENPTIGFSSDRNIADTLNIPYSNLNEIYINNGASLLNRDFPNLIFNTESGAQRTIEELEALIVMNKLTGE